MNSFLSCFWDPEILNQNFPKWATEMLILLSCCYPIDCKMWQPMGITICIISSSIINIQLYMLIPSHTILPHWEFWNIPNHTGASENEAFLVDMQYWYSNHMEIYDDNPLQVVIWAWCHIMQPGFPQNAEHFHNPWVEAQHAEARLLNHPRPSHCSHQVEQES